MLPHHLELLAPARDADIGIEAIIHGADAVYIGGPSFGARAAADNTVQDIARLVKYAHRFDSRIFVTLNTILRDDELEPLSGKELWVRTAICSTAYAVLWGAYYGLKIAMGVTPGTMPDPMVAVIAVTVIAAIGSGVGFASMNLTFGTGAIHFAFYLVVTVLLRLVVGLSPL